jgi:hypothetical protein
MATVAGTTVTPATLAGGYDTDPQIMSFISGWSSPLL